MRKYYPGITIFKFIGSILVLSSHIWVPHFYKSLAYYVTGLEQFFNIIVPCFYIVAGFLAYNGWSHADNPGQYIRRYLTWIIAVYLFLSFGYLSIVIGHQLLKTGLSEPAVVSAIKVFMSDLFIRGAVPALWFIPPLIVGVVVSYFFERRKKLAQAITIASVGFIVAMVFNGIFRPLLERAFGDLQIYHINNIVYTKILLNYFGVGLPFVLIGVVLAKHIDWFMKIDGKRFAAFSLLFTAVEALILHYFIGGHFEYKLVLSQMPLSAWLFYGLLKVKNDKIRTYHIPLNTVSIVIYFSHHFLIRINMYLFDFNVRKLTTIQSIMFLLLILVECGALSAVILSLKKKKQPTLALS
jgi:hypothetical protein